MTSTEDFWRPNTSASLLKARAQLYRQIREYFESQGVLEVDTPSLSQGTVTDRHLDALEVIVSTTEESRRYLQTSPEFAMKRLLAAGSGDIFQICHAFRDGEEGRHHNPEFSLLEWYRINYSIEQLMDEISRILNRIIGTHACDYQRYDELFNTLVKIDITTITTEQLQQLVISRCHGVKLNDRDDCLSVLFSSLIEPKIGWDRPCFVTHYPASQACLAKKDPDDTRFALRFELYYRGLELANGFSELTDAEEQRERFEQDNQKRRQMGKKEQPIDPLFLAALKAGMPDCSGVALGLDRLLMLAVNATHIKEVIAFDNQKA